MENMMTMKAFWKSRGGGGGGQTWLSSMSWKK